MGLVIVVSFGIFLGRTIRRCRKDTLTPFPKLQTSVCFFSRQSHELISQILQLRKNCITSTKIANDDMENVLEAGMIASNPTYDTFGLAENDPFLKAQRVAGISYIREEEISLEKEIGEGFFGKVFKGEPLSLCKQCTSSGYHLKLSG